MFYVALFPPVFFSRLLHRTSNSLPIPRGISSRTNPPFSSLFFFFSSSFHFFSSFYVHVDPRIFTDLLFFCSRVYAFLSPHVFLDARNMGGARQGFFHHPSPLLPSILPFFPLTHLGAKSRSSSKIEFLSLPPEESSQVSTLLFYHFLLSDSTLLSDLALIRRLVIESLLILSPPASLS